MSPEPDSLSTMASREGSPELESASVASAEVFEFDAATMAKFFKVPRVKWKPFLDSFTLFPNLPIEIRQAIWKLTLKARAIEMAYKYQHGFVSSAKIPVALKVCSDSRQAVLPFYPLCFGNVLQKPAVVVNFHLDTIYFDSMFGPHTVPFLLSLKIEEAKQISYIAIDHCLNEYRDYIECPDYDNFPALQHAVQVMTSIKEVNIVYKLDGLWHDHGFPEGSNTIELFDDYPWEIQHYMFNEGVHLDDEDGESECQELPNSDYVLEKFQAPTKGSLWGWRRTSLPMESHPWH